MANFKGITLPDGTTYFPEGSGSAIDTVSVSVDNNTGVPSATGSVSGTTLNLNFKNLKGETGSTGPQGEQGQGVPAGGTTGQVLKKKSGTDYDTEWADETGGGGSVENNIELILEETITGSPTTLEFTKEKYPSIENMKTILVLIFFSDKATGGWINLQLKNSSIIGDAGVKFSLASAFSNAYQVGGVYKVVNGIWTYDYVVLNNNAVPCEPNFGRFNIKNNQDMIKTYGYKPYDKIIFLTNNLTFPENATIKIYGCK